MTHTSPGVLRVGRVLVVAALGLVAHGCTGCQTTRSVDRTGFSMNMAIDNTVIKDRTYDVYFGTGVQRATATVSADGTFDGAAVTLRDGEGTALPTTVISTATGRTIQVNFPGNFIRAVVQKPAGIRPLVKFSKFTVTETTSGAAPEPATAIDAKVLKSYPLSLNEPVFLPVAANEQTFFYLTVNGIRGKGLELLVDGACDVHLSDESRGFVTNTSGVNAFASSATGVFSVLPVDSDHDQWLVTVVAPASADPRTITLSLNENVHIRDLKIRFMGTAEQFQSSNSQIMMSMDEILENASGLLYSITKGHVRLGQAEVVIGQFARSDFHESMKVDTGQLAVAPECFVDPPSKEIRCFRGWWQMSVTDAAEVLAHEFFHHAFSLPDEYDEGFPDVVQQRRDTTTRCFSSIMGHRQLLELCVPGTHGSTPGSRQDPATSMWELLSGRLGNVGVPTRSTTECFDLARGFKLPVNTF